MEYPIWHLTSFGGGFWIAVIATLHVFVAQFAVGGGLFLVVTEKLAYKTESSELLDYVKKHSKFFLLLTMVFGGGSGVALWFCMALLSPEGTLVLVREFLFAWATEWVWFVGEVVALLIYYYYWEKMNRRDHLIIGWFYFIFAFLSLLTINGVVSFMLTPGQWVATRSFWDAIFNPTFWPALFFRTALCGMLAGLFGFVTAARIQDKSLRCMMVRFCGIWTLTGLALTVLSGYWYLNSLPPEQALLVAYKSHRVAFFMQVFKFTAPVLLFGGLFMAICAPRRVNFSSAMLLLVVALLFYGSFEFMREAGRKPYVVWGEVYSTNITVDQARKLHGESILQNSKWIPQDLREINDDNRLEVGSWLYQMQCGPCHSINGPMNDIVRRTSKYTTAGLDAFMSGMGRMNKYMPEFLGTEQERRALAEYIHSIGPGYNPALPEQKSAKIEPAAFKPNQEYVLMAWPLEGLRLVIDKDRTMSITDKGSVVRAQLLLRGDPPEVVTGEVKIVCKPQGMEEAFELNAEDGYFQSPPIEILPYTMTGYQSQPPVEVSAYDVDGNLLASTTIVLPVSTRPGCNNCHGGGWNLPDQGGFSAQTAADIAAVHDRDNHTDFKKRLKNSEVIDCMSCHDGDLQLDLSTALHGFHAVYLRDTSNETCMMCHPQQSLRGMHLDAGLECINCHGEMAKHALALLQSEEDKPVAQKLIKLVTPPDLDGDELDPRKPWEQQPDCLTCHVEFGAPESDSAFGKWTEGKERLFSNRKDEMDAVMCAACHNSPHAIFPAADERDNLRALQYMGEARPIGAAGTCTVCHEDAMGYPAHHPGMGLE